MSEQTKGSKYNNVNFAAEAERGAVRMKCSALKVDGSPCRADGVLNGLCFAHQPGGSERLREASRRGGEATKRKLAADGFTADELPALTDIDSAMNALDVIRIAVMTRRLTHAEGNSASKACSEWIKGHSVRQTQRIVDELQKEVDSKAEEIDELRKQLARR